METPKEKTVYVLFRESLWQSICADAVTLAMMVFCIWFSAGSKFWNFVCFVLLILFMAGRVAKGKSRVMKLTREDMKKWAADL